MYRLMGALGTVHFSAGLTYLRLALFKLRSGNCQARRAVEPFTPFVNGSYGLLSSAIDWARGKIAASIPFAEARGTHFVSLQGVWLISTGRC